MPKSRQFCGFVAGIAAAISTQAQCGYTWTSIPNPTFGGWQCRASVINNHGHVAGYVVNGGENRRGFLWTPEIGTLVLPLPSGITEMFVTGINDQGRVVGSASGPAGLCAFVWDGNGYTLIFPPTWATTAYAHDINEQNTVVGNVINELTGPGHAYRWSGGALEDLHSYLTGDYSTAVAINNVGTTIGNAGSGTYYEPFTFSTPPAEWLPMPANVAVRVTKELNSNGFYIGSADYTVPFLRKAGVVWSPSGIDVLPLHPQYRDVVLNGINSAGRAVGLYNRPFLFSLPSAVPIVWQNGVISEFLPLIEQPAPLALGWLWDINDSGQIVGNYNEGVAVLSPVWSPGDLTGDCHVDLEDLLIVLANFGSPVGTYPRGDVDIDGDVDLADLTVLLAGWGM